MRKRAGGTGWRGGAASDSGGSGGGGKEGEEIGWRERERERERERRKKKGSRNDKGERLGGGSHSARVDGRARGERKVGGGAQMSVA